MRTRNTPNFNQAQEQKAINQKLQIKSLQRRFLGSLTDAQVPESQQRH